MRQLLVGLVVALAAASTAAQPVVWEPASDGLPSGPTTTLDGVAGGPILAGTLGGLYRLTPGGWEIAVADAAVETVTTAPDGIRYALAPTDSVLYRSMDASADGSAWEALSLPGLPGARWGLHALGGGLLYAYIQGNEGCDTDRNGLIWHRSTDRGTSWTCLPEHPVFGHAQGLLVVDDPESDGVALLATARETVGGDLRDVVVRSTDGGQTWERGRAEDGAPLDVDVRLFGGADGGHALLQASDFTVYRSADAGSSWAPTTLEGYPATLVRAGDGPGDGPAGQGRLLAGLRDVTVWIGGEPGPIHLEGGVAASDDGGLTWTRVGLEGEDVGGLAVFGGAVSPSETAFAATESGLYRRDGAGPWRPAGEGLRNQWVLDVAFGPGGAGYVSSYTRRLHHAGADPDPAWEPVEAPPFDEALLDYGDSQRFGTPRFWEVEVGPDGTLYTCDGNLLRSADGGQTWEAFPVGFILDDLNARPDGSLLAAEYDGVHRSTDGGETWERIGGPFPRSVDEVAEGPDGALYAGGFFALYRLAPGATEWEEIGLEGYSVEDLVVDDAGRVWAGLWKWVEVVPGATPPAEGPVALDSFAEETVQTERGTWRRTRLGEAVAGTFATVGTPIRSGSSAIDGSTNQPVYQAVDAGGVLRSTDGGASWEHVGDGFLVRALAVDEAGRVFAGPYVSTDGGENWTFTGDGLRSTDVRTLAVDPEGAVWAGTYGGGLYRTAPASVATEYVPTSVFPALHAFPNPATGTVTVAVSLAERTEVRVDVVDVLGRRVAVLHDGPLSVGEHRLSLDGSGLPAGVYVVRATGGGLDHSRRVTLVR